MAAFGWNEISLPKGDCWCDSPDVSEDGVPYYSEEKRKVALKASSKLIMASGEGLLWAGRDKSLQISYPEAGWRLNPYEPPFVGYRGSINLVNLWVNAALEKE